TVETEYITRLYNINSFNNLTLNFNYNGLLVRRKADPNYKAYGFRAYGVADVGYNALRTVKDRWTPTNPSTSNPSSFWGFSGDGVGDFFLQDAWFIRLQNVSLGYSLPKKWLRGFFSEARIHVDAHNLFVITPYTGIDPETDSYTAAYPNIRSITAGLNFSF